MNEAALHAPMWATIARAAAAAKSSSAAARRVLVDGGIDPDELVGAQLSDTQDAASRRAAEIYMAGYMLTDEIVRVLAVVPEAVMTATEYRRAQVAAVIEALIRRTAEVERVMREIAGVSIPRLRGYAADVTAGELVDVIHDGIMAARHGDAGAARAVGKLQCDVRRIFITRARARYFRVSHGDAAVIARDIEELRGIIVLKRAF